MSFYAALNQAKEAHVNVVKLMREALQAQQYAELARLAPLAEALADIVERFGRTNARGMPSDSNDTTISVVQDAPPRRGSKRIRAYPRFERDGEKLVKVAWSKKERKEYEHRAPRSVVFRVAEWLSNEVGPSKVFAMEDVMPFKQPDGREIPSYQAYLALAWFKQIGAAEQRGKNGHVVTNGKLTRDALEAAWTKLVRH